MTALPQRAHADDRTPRAHTHGAALTTAGATTVPLLAKAMSAAALRDSIDRMIWPTHSPDVPNECEMNGHYTSVTNAATSLDDEAKSARTFRVVDAMRYSFPGDWATVDSDGALVLLGRGSQCINSGGEKVFPEEVEEALKRCDFIDDCLVFGVPDERFGQRIVAVAVAGPGHRGDPREALRVAGEHMAGYKLPRQIVFVDAVPRGPNGKADYSTARTLFERGGG